MSRQRTFIFSKNISLMTAKETLLDPSNLKVAYPTIFLTIISLTIFIGAALMAVNGMLGIGWVILINAVMAYILFTPMHEAGHLNVSGSHKSLRWLDEVTGWIAGVPLLAPFYIFKVVHFRHHAHTNDPEKDPDHWLASKGFVSLLMHSTTIFPVYLIKAIQLLYSKERVTKKVKRDIKIGLFGLFVITLFILFIGFKIGWILLLQVWIIPAVIAQTFLAITFDWLPHHPHEEKARYLNTRVIDIPGLSFFLLGQNYHLIHHLYPRIPFYDYKKVFDELEEEFVEKEVEIISIK